MEPPKPLSCSYTSDGLRRATFDPTELGNFLEKTGATSFVVRDDGGRAFAIARISFDELKQMFSERLVLGNNPS